MPGPGGIDGVATSARAALVAWLRDARLGSDLTLAQVSSRTKIQVRTLELLEAGRFDDLPADVFLRGFVKSYARCVGLSDVEALDRYVSCGKTPGPAAAETGAFAVPYRGDAMGSRTGMSIASSVRRAATATDHRGDSAARGLESARALVEVMSPAPVKTVATPKVAPVAAAPVAAAPEVVAAPVASVPVAAAKKARRTTRNPTEKAAVKVVASSEIKKTVGPAIAAKAPVRKRKATARQAVAEAFAETFATQSTESVAPVVKTAGGAAGSAAGNKVARKSRARAATAVESPEPPKRKRASRNTKSPVASVDSQLALPTSAAEAAVKAVAEASVCAPVPIAKPRRTIASITQALIESDSVDDCTTDVALSARRQPVAPKALLVEASSVETPELVPEDVDVAFDANAVFDAVEIEVYEVEASSVGNSAVSSDVSSDVSADVSADGWVSESYSAIEYVDASDSATADSDSDSEPGIMYGPPVGLLALARLRQASTGGPRSGWMQASNASRTLTIDDDHPEVAENDQLRREREHADRSRTSFLPPILRDQERQGRQGGLTLAVIILLIAATLTLSYLMRRPGSGGEGMTSLPTTTTQHLA